ncbi:hypothetical protein KWG64_16465 [Rahnella sp. PD12R]|uniref:sugar phosphate nucleotidyltransferase n=1 Tax=Rahnella sp. PD12R TaxID=2855688 RepID=UPI001C461F27|nr:sugar phosphate nucleotidyltransferase [Rahnella sp. PD12R]MBV6819535.1 hypothetical protein [Rahnella sp. PD12R]
MNIIVLAAGENYIDSNDKNYPLCLSEINGVSIIQKISEQVSFNKGSTVFLFQEKHIRKFHLDNIVDLLSQKRSSVFPIPENTSGAACTALLGVVDLNQSEPLLIISANQLIDIDFEKFVEFMHESDSDAGTIIFDSIHPRYSYVLLDNAGLVIEASEKKPISRDATAGVYWFKKTGEFTESVKNMIRKDARIDDNFYICPSFNEMILKGLKISAVKIMASQYHPLKSMNQVEFQHR